MDSCWKIFLGGAAALVASKTYEALGLESKITGPLAAVEHGDIGLASIAISRIVPTDHKEYIEGFGATLIVMEFLSPNIWGIGKPTQGLSMALHGAILGTLVAEIIEQKARSS